MTDKKKKQIEDFDNEIGKHNETLDVFKAQLRDSENDLKELDGSQAQELEKILDKLPSATPKGLLDEILRLSTPKRTQILNTISKLSTSTKIEQGKLAKLLLEKQKLQNEIKEEKLDGFAKDLFELIPKVVNTYKQSEDLFNQLKEASGEMPPGWALRGQKMKVHPAFVTVGDSLLKHSSLPNLSLFEFIDRVADLGNYHPDKPFKIQKDSIRQRDNARKLVEGNPSPEREAPEMIEAREPTLRGQINPDDILGIVQ